MKLLACTLLLLVLALSAVTTAAPIDLRTTQIIQALNTLQDAAAHGAAAKPPTLTDATVRKVQTFRSAARLAISRTGSCGDPCRSEIGLALYRLMADPGFAAIEIQFLQPYSTLLKAQLDIR